MKFQKANERFKLSHPVVNSIKICIKRRN